MKLVWRRLIAASLSLSALAAVPADGAQAKPIKAKYSCSKAPSLKVVFDGSKAIVTPKGGKTVTLVQGLAADGFFYRKGRLSLRGRGEQATWTTGPSHSFSCTARKPG